MRRILTSKDLFFVLTLALFVAGVFVTTLAFLPLLAACGIAGLAAALSTAAMWRYAPKPKTNEPEGG
jgi:hypothetical protein